MTPNPLPGLRDRPCPLCGTHGAPAEVRSRRPAESDALEALRPYWFGIEQERHFFTYHRCPSCGLLFNPTFFDADQLADLYAAMPPNMDLVGNEAIVATQRGYFQAAAKRSALTGDYLEIGPDVGHIVAEAARTGDFDRFWLFEPNRAVHDALRAATGGRPATIGEGMEDLAVVPDGSIGLAVVVHVLDHLLDPLAMLAQLRAKLRPGGTLMLVTHDEGSLLRRVLGARWPAFCLQHPELYNPGTMRAALNRAGFHAVAVTRSVNVFPIDFLARQAGRAVGLRLDRLPLPKRAIALRLGNLLTFATAPDRAPDQAGAASPLLERAA